MRRLLSTVTVLTAVAVLAGGLFASPAGAAPEAPTLIGPADLSTVTANPVLSWEPVATATRYKVQIATNPAFTSPVYDVTTYNSQATPPTDLAQVTHYWRVRGIDAGNVNGPYSATWSFDKTAGPAPVPVAPLSGQNLVFPDAPLLFSWEPVVGAKTYEFQIDDENLFTAPNTVSTSTNNTSYTLAAPQTIDQTFYWRVRAKSPAGVPTLWSDPIPYTMSWPGVPELLSPANTTIPSIEEVAFEWTPVNGAAGYQLQISPNEEFTGVSPITVESTRYSPLTTLNNDAYFWRVRAVNVAGGTGGYSETHVFNRSWPAPELVAPPSPNPPTDCVSETDFRVVGLCAPANDSVATEMSFTWTPVRLGSRYQVQVSTDQFFVSGVTTYTTNHTTYTPVNATGFAADTYYWRVRPLDDPLPVNGLWSATASFDYQPAMVTPTSPANNASVSTPLLTWKGQPGNGVYEVTIRRPNATVAESAVVSNTSYVPQTLVPAEGPFTWSVKKEGGPDQSAALSRTFTLVPPAPTFASPDPVLAGSQGQFYAPVLTWQPVTGANRYEVWGAPTGDSFTQLPQAGALTSAAFAYSGYDVEPGQWSFEVRAFSNATPISTGSIGTFVILPALTSRPLGPAHCPASLVCPDVYDTPTLSWDPLPGATHYTLVISRDINFTNVISTVTGVRSTSYTPPSSLVDSQAGQAIYWYARPVLPVGGPEAASFATDPDSPVRAFRKRSLPVRLLSPTNGAEFPNQITFEWEDYLCTNQAPDPISDGDFTCDTEAHDSPEKTNTQVARTYRVQVSNKADFSTLLDQPVVDQTTYTAYNKTYPDGQLFWRVQAIDPSNNSLTFSETRTLTKESPKVVQVAPSDGATVSGVPLFTWQAHPYAVRYDVEVYKNPTPPEQGLVLANRVLTGNTAITALSPTASLPAGDYGWRIRRLDSDNRPGPWSAETNGELRKFTLQGDPATLISPADDANLFGNSLLFEWQPGAGAAQSRIQISTTADFAVLKENQATAMSAWAPTINYVDGRYYWRVQSLDAGNNVIATSETRFFDKGPVPPGPPTNVTAVAGNREAVVSWSPPVFDGGAPITGYTVTSSPGGFTCTKAAPPLTCTVTGLTNGTPYTFSVTATNSTGVGEASAPSNVVVPELPPGSLFTSLAPRRILDSRPASVVGPYSTPWTGGQTREVTVTGGLSGVPADAQAVALNVTVTGTSASSYLAVWPKGADQPVASNLNWQPGWTIPNAVTVKIGDGGKVNIYNNNGSADVVIDVVGYYREGTGGGFTSLAPVRIQDSRPASQVGPFATPWGGGITRSVTVTGGSTGVPADADSVVLNVTATGTTASSYLTVWPKGADQPVASSLNWQPGRTIPNAVTVKVGSGGQIDVFNNNGNVHVVIDVVGYFKAGTGAEFHPQAPVRIQDSRSGSKVGPYSTAWGQGVTRPVTVTGLPADVPTNATAVLLNVTVTGTTGSSFLSIWPEGVAQPLASSLNWQPGWTIPNAVTVKVGTDGKIRIFNNVATTHVVADVAGWYG